MTSRAVENPAWRRILLIAAVGVFLFTNFAWGPGISVATADDFEIVNPEKQEPAVRTWTAASGSTVDAKFVRLDGGDVFLAREDGIEFRIPASKLSSADIDYVKARTPDAAGLEQAVAAPDTAPAVPVKKKKGKAAGSSKDKSEPAYGVYEHANFDAVVDSTGSVLIYPKNKGERIAKPLEMFARITYKQPYRGARVINLSPPGELVRQPKTLTLRGTTEDHSKTRQKVDYEVTYSFEGNEVSAWGRSLGEGSYKEPETLEIMASIPSTHHIEPSVEQPERIKILKDYSLLLKGGEGGTQTYDYYTGPKFGKLTCKTAELIGPFWEPRNITVSRSSKKAPLKPYVYPGRLLWQGFSLFVVKPDPKADAPSQKMVITIE